MTTDSLYRVRLLARLLGRCITLHWNDVPTSALPELTDDLRPVLEDLENSADWPPEGFSAVSVNNHVRRLCKWTRKFEDWVAVPSLALSKAVDEADVLEATVRLLWDA